MFKGLLSNPEFLAGASILGSRGNIGRGLLGYSQMQNAMTRNKLAEMQMQEMKQKQDQLAAQRQILQGKSAQANMAGSLFGDGTPGSMGRFTPTFSPATAGYADSAPEQKQALLEKAALAGPNSMANILALGKKPDTPYGKLTPSSYTPESLARFNQTGNYADLRAIPKVPLVDMRNQVLPTETQLRREDILSRASDARAFNKTILNDSFTASKRIGEMDRALTLLDSVNTGPLEEGIVNAKKLANMFGFEFDPAKISSAEELRVLMGNQVMQRVSETKGAVSEREMELFRQYSANYGNTPEGNRAIINFQKAKAQRDIELGKLVRDMRRRGALSSGIEEAVYQYIAEHPIDKYLAVGQSGGEGNEQYTADDVNKMIDELEKLNQ